MNGGVWRSIQGVELYAHSGGFIDSVWELHGILGYTYEGSSILGGNYQLRPLGIFTLAFAISDLRQRRQFRAARALKLQLAGPGCHVQPPAAILPSSAEQWAGVLEIAKWSLAKAAKLARATSQM